MKIRLSDEVKTNLAKKAKSDMKQFQTVFYSEKDFVDDVKCYIKALEEGRVLYDVTSVSSTGMSRNILIRSCERRKEKGMFWFRNYRMMLDIFGHTRAKNGDDIRVGGCGMNMLFNTNYNLMQYAHSMGFIDKEKRDDLAQKIN